MRILTLSNCPLNPSQGSGYVVLHHAEGLRQRGHEVDLVGPDELELLPALRRGKLLRLAAGIGLKVFSRLRQRTYDVVEFYGAQSWLAVTLLHHLPRRQFLVVAHTNGIEMHADEALRRHTPLPIRRAFTDADGIVTVSQFDRAYALRQRLKSELRIKAIENALPDDWIGLKPEFHRPPRLGFCGSWLPIKGTEAIRGALPIILREFTDLRVSLIGVGEGFKASAHFPADISPRIDVEPFVASRAELARRYQEVSVLMMPSVYESFGLVSAEAMACGCAVAASRTGFPAGLKPEEEVLHLEDSSAASLANGLRRLLLDDSLRQRIARGGHKRVQSLRWRDASEELDRTYREWLDDYRSKGG